MCICRIIFLTGASNRGGGGGWHLHAHVLPNGTQLSREDESRGRTLEQSVRRCDAWAEAGGHWDVVHGSFVTGRRSARTAQEDAVLCRAAPQHTAKLWQAQRVSKHQKASDKTGGRHDERHSGLGRRPPPQNSPVGKRALGTVSEMEQPEPEPREHSGTWTSSAVPRSRAARART